MAAYAGALQITVSDSLLSISYSNCNFTSLDLIN